MAAEDISVQQNTMGGPSTDLNQGEAGAINEMLPTQSVSEGETIVAPEMDEMADLELAEPGDYEPDFVAETEDEDFLTGESMRTDEDILQGIQAMPNEHYIDANLRRSLPELAAAANQPGASEQLKTIVRFLAREANL